jgi:CRISPR-associated protein Csm1
MKTDQSRKSIVLGALLHDIGKFWQRADHKYSESEVLKEFYQPDSLNVTVPLYESGYPKYAHALWTNAFLSKTRTGQKLKLNGAEDHTLANLSANHHKPNNHLEAIISVADKWSSGIDRPDEGEEGVSGYTAVKQKYKSDFIKKVQLHSIFDTIHRSYDEIDIHHSFPLTPLTIDELIFPSEEDTDSVGDDYLELWNEFYAEYNSLLNAATLSGETDFRAFMRSLCTLLKKYTWSVPSAANLLPACVSLHEHLKSTAAIALSLYDYCDSTQHIFETDEHSRITNTIQTDALLMVCVDISGIQKFIYDISSRRAAVSLKGRSFYLEILLRNILNEILTHADIDAYDCNIVYASGGKAYLILPNLDKVKLALSDLQTKISKAIYDENKEKLFVSIGHTSFRYETHFGDIIEGRQKGKKGFVNKLKTDQTELAEKYRTADNPEFDLSMLWRSVSDQAARAKNVKFKDIYMSQYVALFLDGEDFVAKAKKCSVTGEWIEGRAEYLYADKSGAVSEVVFNQIELGKKLKSGSAITYVENGQFDTIKLGQRFSISEVADRQIINGKLHLNQWPTYEQVSYGQGHLFYGGNYQPSIVDIKGHQRPKTFEELCYVEHIDREPGTEDAPKLTKLGILRMDVDNLGQIFINGLIEPSFASYATLSMMLDTFFSGMINNLQQKDDRYKNHLQILYSGGDDLFAVGRWDTVIDFATDIRVAFSAFTQRNDITLSAGIAITGAKYPIYKAAEEAGRAEKQAKNYISEEYGSKNAICLFGEAISWQTEWTEVQDMKNTLLAHLQKNSIPRSLLHTIQDLKIKKDAHRKGNGDMSYIWQSGYKLTRMMDRTKDRGSKTLIREIRDAVYHNPKHGSERYLDLIAVAARWAELINKLNKS